MEVENGNEYALYQQDTFLSCGTLKEISEETGISIKQCECFAFMLKQKRLDKKLSRNELSEILGYTVSEIEKWENKRKQPNYYIVEDVATYFKIPVNVLIGEA
jgi:DNA-binding helix-turn-helix protein|nr:MAG TPA: helix-turn-helix domain protein [Caudoviricetes sp.]